MEEIIVATPLKGVEQPYQFSNSITVRAVEPILWEQSIIKGFVSEHDRENLQKTKYWLCAGKQVEYPTQQSDELFELVHHAQSTTQIIYPFGGGNVFLKFHRTSQGYDNVGSWHPSRLHSTLMGRIGAFEKQGFATDFETVYTGVRRAFDEKILRLQNPILLLEHGQQIGNVPLSALFWVLGLDMLFMAGGSIDAFVDRISGFLGPDSFIFPVTEIFQQQPFPRVKDVLGDLYVLRNKIAHGLEIPKLPYRKEYHLHDTYGAVITGENYLYLHLMQESALFILCKSLRKILVEGFVDDVKDDSKWKLRLKIGAKTHGSP